MHKLTSKRSRLVVLAATAALGTALSAVPASAHGDATCADALGSGIVVHGQHIVGDYVTGLGGIFGDGLQWPPAGQVGDAVSANGGAAMPGGPGPGFHFGIPGLPPGASFCNEQAHPNGFTTPPAQANGLNP
jgi:hypothetical protein